MSEKQQKISLLPPWIEHGTLRLRNARSTTELRKRTIHSDQRLFFTVNKRTARIASGIDSPEACPVMSSLPNLRTSALHTKAIACTMTSSFFSAPPLPSKGRGQIEGQTLHQG